MEGDQPSRHLPAKSVEIMAKSTGEQRQPPAPTGDQGQQDGNKRKSEKRTFKPRHHKSKPGKIHIRLPTIESYKKEIEFAAEAPGRVVVRLERLMGSDKIRPVDGKYMATLIQRLEDEEKIAWERKIRLRKKAEKERFRQLAILGLMEPGPGMEDLYNHPVFRVNRILNRLSKLNNTFAASAVLKLPPIVQVEPFEYDESGATFKEYPQHRMMSKHCLLTKEQEEELKRDEEDADESYADYVAQEAENVPGLEDAEEEDEDEFDEELLLEDNTAEEALSDNANPSSPAGEPTEMEEINEQLHQEYMDSLATLQKRYNVPQVEGFEDMWKPFRCELVNKLFTDVENLEEVYGTAMEIIEVYIRQEMVGNEHIANTKDVGVPPKPGPEAVPEPGEDAEEEVEAEGEEVERGEEEALVADEAVEEDPYEEETEEEQEEALEDELEGEEGDVETDEEEEEEA